LQALDEGKEEGRRLAASGLGGGDEVTAGKRKGDYLLLNGRRGFEAQLTCGLKQLSGETEVSKDRRCLAG